MKRITSLMLSAVVLLTMFTACNDTNSGQTESQKSEMTDTIDTTIAEESVLTDNLPDKNYNGEEFNMLVRTERLYYLHADEMNGDMRFISVIITLRSVSISNFNYMMS